MNNDAWASLTRFVLGNSLLLLKSIGSTGLLTGEEKTPQRGDRLNGLATAAKEECVK